MGSTGAKRKIKTAFLNHMKGIELESDGTLAAASATTASGGTEEVAPGDAPTREAVAINAGTAYLLDDHNMPKKRFFRTRAHCNPLSHNDGFKYPVEPTLYDWKTHYPSVRPDERVVRFLDIGMGFGGLTVALAKLFPDKLCLGMEIRAKVCEYVRLRIEALRGEHEGSYGNASCLRTNCMRYLPNFFAKGQIEKIFFCFPDPHFKPKNHRRRIVNDNLLTEYAYFLAPQGLLYTITDVLELHTWHVEKCNAHPCFERIPDEEILRDDPAVTAMIEETEEGHKVARNNGKKYFAVYRKREVTEMKIESLFN